MRHKYNKRPNYVSKKRYAYSYATVSQTFKNIPNKLFADGALGASTAALSLNYKERWK